MTLSAIRLPYDESQVTSSHQAVKGYTISKRKVNLGGRFILLNQYRVTHE